MRYFAASVNKNQGTIRIPFVEPFSAPPVVILSPQWNSGNAVGAVPTITQITADAVVVSDGNQASDYYVNVLAVEQGVESLDGQPAFPGIVSKNSASVAVTISGPAPSAVLLTPYWPEGPVGSVETLDLQTSMLDPKTTLQEWAQAAGLALPLYTVVKSEGPPHDPVFEVEVTVAGHEPASARGRSKRAAEQAAARQLLDRVGA